MKKDLFDYVIYLNNRKNIMVDFFNNDNNVVEILC